jgi:DNA-binding LytR/AlgR family response regulator
MIKAIALDDEPLPLEVLEAYCAKTDSVSLERTFTKVSEAQKYMRKFPVDLLFLDIHMPALSGIDFLKTINQDTMVIFSTAHSKYAIEGFNLKAVDYLLKPYSFERFQAAIGKAEEYYTYKHLQESSVPEYLFIRADYSLVKITIADILFVESFGDYLTIHIQDQKSITVRMTMKVIFEKLPPKKFIRIHRSYIVPIHRVEQVRNKTITIAGTEIPLGASYEEEFYKVFKA